MRLPKLTHYQSRYSRELLKILLSLLIARASVDHGARHEKRPATGRRRGTHFDSGDWAIMKRARLALGRARLIFLHFPTDIRLIGRADQCLWISCPLRSDF